MIFGFESRAGSPLPLGRLKLILLVWIVAEVVAFGVVVRLFGLGGAVLLGLLTTVLGVMRLQRIGLQTMRGFRGGIAGALSPDAALRGNALAGLGAVLMILPGFASDALGLALAAPTVQRWFARLVAGQAQPPAARPRASTRRPFETASPDVIDLRPEDWRVVDKP